MDSELISENLGNPGRGATVKKILVLLLVCFSLFFCFSATASALTVDAASCILIDAATGRVLFENNAHQALPPASTTKMLTALLALESGMDLSEQITLPEDFVNVGESGINLKAGETLSMEDLLYALMLRSANDAAQAIAISVSGSEEAFMEKMNARTAQLGLTDSHWQNPHGLDEQNHLASAYDLAIIAREALTIPFFNELIATDRWSLPWAANDFNRILYNHNQFLTLYDGADGVKTGYTALAGNCLVGSATRDGMRLIGVVMNCPDQTHYAQMTLLMDYGFANYEPLVLGNKGDVLGKVKVVKGDLSEVDAVLGDDIVIAVAKGETVETTPALDLPRTIKAPCTRENPIGSISYSDGSGNTVIAPLYLKDCVERYTFPIVIQSVWQSVVDAFF